MLRQAIGDNDPSTLPLRIYLEWGRWDPLGGEIWDCTDWASWSNRTGVMVESLFPADGVSPSLGAWRTTAQ